MVRYDRRLARSCTALACLFLAAGMVACSGIPLLSIPKLITLSGKLIDANPEEFLIAIQSDERLAPAPASSPVLNVDIKPDAEGDFPRISRMLYMRSTHWSSNLKGLDPPPPSRKWLVYAFTPESAAELRRMQSTFRELKGKSRGATVTLGISQDAIAAGNPALADTKWESWLQASRADGFFKLRSGKVGDLLSQPSPK